MLRINRVSTPTILFRTVTIKVRHGNHAIMTTSTKLYNVRLSATSIYRSTNRRGFIIMKLNRRVVTTRFRHPCRYIYVIRAKDGGSKTIMPTTRTLTRFRTINVQRGSVRRSRVRLFPNITRHFTTNIDTSRLGVLLAIRRVTNDIPSRQVVFRRGGTSRPIYSPLFNIGLLWCPCLMCHVSKLFSANSPGFLRKIFLQWGDSFYFQLLPKR